MIYLLISRQKYEYIFLTPIFLGLLVVFLLLFVFRPYFFKGIRILIVNFYDI